MYRDPARVLPSFLASFTTTRSTTSRDPLRERRKEGDAAASRSWLAMTAWPMTTAMHRGDSVPRLSACTQASLSALAINIVCRSAARRSSSLASLCLLLSTTQLLLDTVCC